MNHYKWLMVIKKIVLVNTVTVEPLENDSFSNLSKPSIDEIERIEEIQPVIEFLLVGQSPDFIPERRQSSKLFESIEELCLLIRKLLQYELTEQKITSLQATIANQLAILLTYLAVPNRQTIISDLKVVNTMEKMTSTEEDNVSLQKPLVSTIATQTDLLVDLKAQQSSSENKQETTIDIRPLSQKETSHTDLISTSGKNRK